MGHWGRVSTPTPHPSPSSPLSPPLTIFEMIKVTVILSKTTHFRLFQTERVLQTTISNVIKIAESFPNE